MRTAVIRITVDPRRELAPEFLREQVKIFAAQANSAGMTVLELPSEQRRELHVLLPGTDGPQLRDAVAKLCAEIFGTQPETGPVTFVSRGTDDDAHGVLAGFGITGEVSRTDSGSGYDIVTVRIPAGYLERIPESRVHTALEAALNCEVRLVVD
jgi:hypothetical protein